MSWKKTKIGEFLFEREGRFKPDDKSLLNLDRLEKIDFSGNFYIGQKASRTDMILIKKGDFVISGINVSKGAMGIYREDKDITATIHYSSYTFDESKIDINYFEHFLQSSEFIKLLEEQVKSGIKTEIKARHLLNLEIFLPSLDQQKQIAEKLKHSEERQKRLQQEIDNQKTNLKNLRKQILQDAIEGKLTKEWREKNPDIEPASELLKKIKKEKEKLISEKKIKKEKPLPEINKNEIPFELPESWVWTRLGDIGLVNRGKSPKYDLGSNVFSLNQKCVRWNYIDTVFAKEIKLDWLVKIDKNFLTQLGDILINSTGEGTIGRSAVVDEISNKMIFDSHILCFRGTDFIKTKFFTSVINSSFGQLQINQSKGAKSTKQTELGVANLRNIFSPLPPLPEQLAIVSKLQTLMQKLDEAQNQIEKSLDYSKQLYSAILGETFNLSK